MKIFFTVLTFLLLVSCSENIEPREVKKTASPEQSREYLTVEFKKQLASFDLPLPDKTMADQEDLKFITEALPEEVQKMNKRKIIIKGFMIPLKFTKDEKIESFLLAPDQGACCFGKSPELNEVIYCTSPIAYADLRDILLEVKGTLSTVPAYNETDKTVYLYQMKVESIKELKAMPPPGPSLSF